VADRKTEKLPNANGIPASTGLIQWTELRAVQANQNNLANELASSLSAMSTICSLYAHPIGTAGAPSIAAYSRFSGAIELLPCFNASLCFFM
jgi:hypothetical protein